MYYKTLKEELLKNNMNKRQLSQASGIKYNTLLSKMSGKSIFILDEAVKIKECINTEKTIKELFER